MYCILEPGTCYDDSDACEKIAQEGKCTNSALHQYANYCKRSCGICSKFGFKHQLFLLQCVQLFTAGYMLNLGNHQCFLVIV